MGCGASTEAQQPPSSLSPASDLKFHLPKGVFVGGLDQDLAVLNAEDDQAPARFVTKDKYDDKYFHVKNIVAMSSGPFDANAVSPDDTMCRSVAAVDKDGTCFFLVDGPTLNCVTRHELGDGPVSENPAKLKCPVFMSTVNNYHTDKTHSGEILVSFEGDQYTLPNQHKSAGVAWYNLAFNPENINDSMRGMNNFPSSPLDYGEAWQVRQIDFFHNFGQVKMEIDAVTFTLALINKYGQEGLTGAHLAYFKEDFPPDGDQVDFNEMPNSAVHWEGAIAQKFVQLDRFGDHKTSFHDWVAVLRTEKNFIDSRSMGFPVIELLKLTPHYPGNPNPGKPHFESTDVLKLMKEEADVKLGDLVYAGGKLYASFVPDEDKPGRLVEVLVYKDTDSLDKEGNHPAKLALGRDLGSILLKDGEKTTQFQVSEKENALYALVSSTETEDPTNSDVRKLNLKDEPHPKVEKRWQGKACGGDKPMCLQIVE